MSDNAPLNNSVKATSSKYTKRNPYVWFAISAIKLGTAGYSFYSTISACNDWSTGGKKGKCDCVVGAIDTGVSLGSFLYVSSNSYITISNRLAENGYHIPGLFKRDVDHEHELLNAAARSLVAGTPHSATALLHPNGSFVANDQTKYPIFVVKTLTVIIIIFLQ